MNSYRRYRDALIVAVLLAVPFFFLRASIRDPRELNSIDRAVMRISVEPAVARWFDAQSPESVWTTTITVFEIRFGLALLAPGRRRDQLHDAVDIAIDDVLGGRVLPFDRTAAALAAK